MSPPITVFLNGRAVVVPAGSVARDVVRAGAPELAAAWEKGEVSLTDGRALPVAPDAPLAAGAILRATLARRRIAPNA
jgi:hypothetical protein